MFYEVHMENPMFNVFLESRQTSNKHKKHFLILQTVLSLFNVSKGIVWDVPCLKAVCM